MLPAGLAAHPADRADQQRLQTLLPPARTAIRLVVGECSCDLVRARHADPREDERHHRARFRQSGRTRDALLAMIAGHRRGDRIPAPAGGWPRALAAFVAEHARNAGETLYLLRFAEPGPTAGALAAPRRIRAADVLARPDGWLDEHGPVIVGG